MHKDFPMHIQQIKFYDICLLPCCVDEATNRIEKAEQRCAMLGQMVDRLEEAERRMGTLDQIGPDVLALIRRIEQMEFKATIARDEHDNLAQRHDHFTRLVAYDRDVDLLVLPARYLGRYRVTLGVTHRGCRTTFDSERD